MKSANVNFSTMSLILKKFLDFVKMMNGISEAGAKVIDSIVVYYEKVGKMGR